MEHVPDILDALSRIAWPIILAVLLWKLYPSIRDIVQRRGFTLKIGDNELTVQEFSQQVVESSARVQMALAEMEAAEAQKAGDLGTTSRPRDGKVLRTVLWVDDNPNNNAYEVAQLRHLGLDVRQVLSTAEAMDQLSARRFDAIITDLGRKEGASFRPMAGAEFIRLVRQQGENTPIFVYAGPRAQGLEQELLDVGASGVTTSSVSLTSLLLSVGGFPHGSSAT